MADILKAADVPPGRLTWDKFGFLYFFELKTDVSATAIVIDPSKIQRVGIQQASVPKNLYKAVNMQIELSTGRVLWLNSVVNIEDAQMLYSAMLNDAKLMADEKSREEY